MGIVKVDGVTPIATMVDGLFVVSAKTKKPGLINTLLLIWEFTNKIPSVFAY